MKEDKRDMCRLLLSAMSRCKCREKEETISSSEKTAGVGRCLRERYSFDPRAGSLSRATDSVLDAHP